jgi:hypothetical protein
MITAEDRRMRLPWWGVLCIIIGGLPVMYLFDHLGQLDLARPTLFFTGMIAIAIAMRWRLRQYRWFWVTMAAVLALHIAVILLVPWTTKWVPSFVIIPVGIADLYAILMILSVVGRFRERHRL